MEGRFTFVAMVAINDCETARFGGNGNVSVRPFCPPCADLGFIVGRGKVSALDARLFASGPTREDVPTAPGAAQGSFQKAIHGTPLPLSALPGGAALGPLG